MKTAIIVGTRPEIIKMVPLIKLLKKSETSVIFSSQHYDYNLGLKFFEELDLPEPDFKLKIKKDLPTIQIGHILIRLQSLLSELNPDTTIVQGDTNTALAGAVCSLKNEISISHVESGLRSFDWRMPEEHNRIMIDHVSDFLFAPTKNSKINLLNEKVHGNIFITGNTIMDSIKQHIHLIGKKSKLNIAEDNFILCTMHRAENVDDEVTIKNLVSGLLESKEKIIFPMHPRTLKRLHQFNLFEKVKNAENIKNIAPVGYFEMLELMKKCKIIITDSGGIQEEATSPFISKRVIVIRKTTDRPESVQNGFSRIVGTSKQNLLTAIKQTMKNPDLKIKKSPYGEGNSGKIIVSILKKYF